MSYALVCGWDVLWCIKTREPPVPLMQANFGGIFCQCETRRWRLLPAQARLAAAGGLRRRAAEPHEAIVDSNRTRKEQRVRRGAQARERARVLRREGQGRARGGVRVHARRTSSAGEVTHDLEATHFHAVPGCFSRQTRDVGSAVLRRLCRASSRWLGVLVRNVLLGNVANGAAFGALTPMIVRVVVFTQARSK